MKEGTKFHSQHALEIGSFSLVVLALAFNNIIKELHNLTLWLRKVLSLGIFLGCSHVGSQWVYCVKLWKWGLYFFFFWESKIKEMAESLDTCQGKLLTCGTSPRESSVLQSTEVVGNPKSAWTLEFTLLAFVLVVVTYFFTKLPFLLFGMVMYKMYHLS